MKYEVGEILNQAIMTDTISLIVEGLDDVQIYEKIARDVGKDIAVFPIGCIEEYSFGCGHVELAMDEILLFPEGEKYHKDYILGVIDKDVRDYRNEIPKNPLLITLKYYSIESHFINKHVLFESILLNTKTPVSLITPELVSYIYDQVFSESEVLFLFSLEALRCAMIKNYEAIFQYGFSEGRIFSEADKRSILEKKEELYNSALELKLVNNVETLKCIVKGKWLLHYFCHKVSVIINALKESCGVSPQNQCVICAVQADHNSCLYRLKDGVTPKSFKNTIFGNINSPDLDYIKKRINEMV